MRPSDILNGKILFSQRIILHLKHRHHRNMIQCLLAVLLLASASKAIIAAQPLIGGHLSWSINHEFMKGNRSVNITLMTAFMASEDCNYELGQVVTCNSTDNVHGTLNLQPQVGDKGSNNGFFAGDNIILVNQFVTVDTVFSAAEQKIVIGILQHTEQIPEIYDGLLVWVSFGQDSGRPFLPPCSDLPNQRVCSASELFSRKLQLPSYWSGFFPESNSSFPHSLSGTELFVSFIPLCSYGVVNREHCSLNPVINLNSPVASISPIFSVPLTGESPSTPPLFNFKSYDDDGDKMTQFIPSDFSQPSLIAPCVFPQPDSNGAPPGWQTELCMGGYRRGMPCSPRLESADCGLGAVCAPTWSGCREFRDGDPDVASAAGNLLRFNFSFGGQATPFPSSRAGPLARDSAAAGCPSCAGITGVSQHAVFTFDYPWTSSLTGPDAWPASHQMPSWRNASASVLTIFSVFPNDCGEGNRPPVFVRSLGSVNQDVETERSCVFGVFCEIVLYARDFASESAGSLPSQTQHVVRVELAPGFRGRASLERTDGSECVGEGSLECIVSIGMPTEGQRVGSTQVLCFVASDNHVSGNAAKSCTSLPLCLKIRLDAFPLASRVLLLLGSPVIGLNEIRDESWTGFVGWKLLINVSWAIIPSDWEFSDRISNYRIEYSVDESVYAPLGPPMGAGESSLIAIDSDFVLSGSHSYTFRVVALCSTGSNAVKYYSLPSIPIKLFHPYSSLLLSARLFYSTWEGQVFSLFQKEEFNSDKYMGYITSPPIVSKSTVIDCDRDLIISFIPGLGIGKYPQMLSISIKDSSIFQLRDVNLPITSSLWNLEIDETAEAVVAICMNLSHSMIISIPVPTTADFQPLPLTILSFLPCPLSSQSPCQVLFSVSAFDRFSRVYYYVDAATRNIMAYSILESRFWQLPIFSEENQVFSMIFDDHRSNLVVFTGAWPTKPNSTMRMSRVRPGSPAQIMDTYLISIDPSVVKLGSIACDSVNDYCLFASLSGSVVKYDIKMNHTTEYRGFSGSSVVDMLFCKDRTPILRAVNPSSVNLDVAELSIYGANFGVRPEGIYIRIGNVLCNQTILKSDRLIVCFRASLSKWFDRGSLGITIKNENHINHFEDVIYVLGESWTELIPKSQFITLAFGQRIAFYGSSFLQRAKYRCLFASRSHGVLCGPPLTLNSTSLIFEMPLWLGIGQDTSAYLLIGQDYSGLFQPNYVIANYAESITKTFSPSWKSVTPTCLYLGDVNPVIKFYGLGFDPFKSTICMFLNNGNYSATDITTRKIVCAISSPELIQAGIETVFPLQLPTSTSDSQTIDFYNGSCFSVLRNCIIHSLSFRCCPTIQINGKWTAMIPTTGDIGRGTLITVLGSGFSPALDIFCCFQAGEQSWSFPSVVLNSESLICNTSLLKSGRNILEFTLNSTRSILTGISCQGCNFSSGCNFLSGPALTFQFKSYFRTISSSSATAAGGQQVTIFGFGFDTTSLNPYKCNFGGDLIQTQEAVLAQSISDTEIRCQVPKWQYASSLIYLRIYVIDTNLLSAPEEEFLFEYSQNVDEIKGMQLFIFESATFQVWGSGFHLNTNSYDCVLSSNQSSVGVVRQYAIPKNYSLLICENLTVISSVVQLRIYFLQPDHAPYLLKSVFFTCESSWSSLIPESISLAGGILTVYGKHFQGQAHEYQLNLCYLSKVCPWQNLTADNVADQSLVFVLPQRNTDSGAAFPTLTYRGAILNPVSASPKSLSVLPALTLSSPNIGCIDHNNSIFFSGFGFLGEHVEYSVKFEDKSGAFVYGNSCSALQETLLQCWTSAWPHPAVVQATLIAGCRSENAEYNCPFQQSNSVTTFSFTFTACVTAVEPTSASAAKSRLLFLQGIGYGAPFQAICRFQVLDVYDIVNTGTTGDAHFADTQATVHSSTLVSCFSPAWRWSAGIVNIYLFLDGFQIFIPSSLKFRILPEIMYINPTKGSQAGRVVTVYGAGFSVLHNYVCSVYETINSTSVTPSDPTMLLCRIPRWLYGNATITLIDITDNVIAVGQVVFNYGEGIKSLSVSIGPASGGTEIYLIGEAFDSTTQYQANFGGLAWANIVFVNSSNMQLVSPIWNHPSGIVEVTLSDGFRSIDAGIVNFEYFEVISSIVPSAGLIFGSYLSLRGFGFRQEGSYRCILTSRNVSWHSLETRSAKPRQNQSSEIEFTIPRWKFSGDVLELSVFSEIGRVLSVSEIPLTFEVKSAWTSLDYDSATSFIGGTEVTIHGAGFKLNSSYTCQLRGCYAPGMKCTTVNSSASSLPCNDIYCSRGPYRAKDQATIICFVPAWLNSGNSAFVRVFEDDDLVEQVLVSPPKISFSSAPLITPSKGGVNAPYWGGALLNLSGISYGFVDLSVRARIGSSSCSVTEWVSNTQIRCLTPRASSIETGISILVSISQFRVGTVSQALTYDGPIPDRFVRFESNNNDTKAVFEKVANTPSLETDSRIAISGSFAYVDLSIKSRFGYSFTESTLWMSSSFLLCKTSAGTGVDLSVALILDSIVVTSSLGFMYDGPSQSSHKNSNIMPYLSQSFNMSYVQILGQNIGVIGSTPLSRIGSSTSAESTLWVSDSTLSVKISPGFLKTLQVGITISSSIGSASEALTYHELSLMKLQFGNMLAFASASLGSAGSILTPMTASVFSAIGHTGCEMSQWSSDTAIFLKSIHGIQGSHTLAITVGIQSGTISSVHTYDSPSIVYSLFEVSEGLRSSGPLYSTHVISALLGFKLCNDTSQTDYCDWKLIYASQAQISYGSWDLCDSNISDINGKQHINDLDCRDSPSNSNSNLLMKYSGSTKQSPTGAKSLQETYIVYVGNYLHSSFYPGWYTSIAEFTFAIEDESESLWLSFLFAYLDTNNFYTFEMNNVLGIYNIRKQLDGSSTSWACDPDQFTFGLGKVYNVRLEVLQTSISVLVNWNGGGLYSGSENQIWLNICQVYLDSRIGAVSASGSFGLSGAGAGTAVFMNLRVYNPLMLAKRSNLMSPFSTSLMAVGIGFGLLSLSSKLKIEKSSCEASFWSSDTVVFCRVANTVGSTLRNSLTVGSEKGTLSEILSYSTPLITGANYVNGLYQQLKAFSVQLTGLNSITVAADIGQTSCEASAWISSTSIQCKYPSAQSRTVRIACTVGKLAGSETALLSYDKWRLQVIKTRNGAATGGKALSIFGGSMGNFNLSPAGRIYNTACGSTLWLSDTGLKCLPLGNLLATCILAVTVAIQLGTVTTAVSSDRVVASSLQRANQLSSSDLVFMQGSNFGVAAHSDKMSLGRSAGEASIWISDSTLRVNAASSLSTSLKMQITANVRVGTCSVSSSFDRPIILSANVSFNQGNVSSIRLVSKGLGRTIYSISSGIGFSQAERTGWVSETSAFSLISTGVGGNLLLRLTAMSAVGSSEFGISYRKPAIGPNLSSSVVVKVYGTWCAVENSLCACAGIVQFKSLTTPSSSYVKSNSSVSCSSLTTFADPAPGSIKSCYCYNWPFAGMQKITIFGSGFGLDDFTPTVTISSTKSAMTNWISDSSILATMPSCTDCGTTTVTQNVVVNVARQASDIGTFPTRIDLNISIGSSCPFFWSNSGTYVLSSSSGMLCRINTGSSENISWIIDPCTTNNQCILALSADTVALIQATIRFTVVPNYGDLSLYSCSTLSCDFPIKSGLSTVTSISGNPYLKVMWNAGIAATGSSWFATWNSSTNISYRIFQSPALNFTAAEAACKALSTNGNTWHLASITSAQEVAALGSLSSSRIVWIGLHYNTSGSREWTDGTAFGAGSYSNWMPGFVFSDPTQCAVAHLNLLGNFWTPQLCSTTYSYACSKKAPFQ